MKFYLTLIIASAVMLAPAHAAAGERDMTCRGELIGSNDVHAIFADSGPNCYIQANPIALDIVNASCKIEQPCVVRARVIPRATPHGMPPSFTILKVYSARKK
jgi:hypothetical protein